MLASYGNSAFVVLDQLMGFISTITAFDVFPYGCSSSYETFAQVLTYVTDDLFRLPIDCHENVAPGVFVLDLDGGATNPEPATTRIGPPYGVEYRCFVMLLKKGLSRRFNPRVVRCRQKTL